MSTSKVLTWNLTTESIDFTNCLTVGSLITNFPAHFLLLFKSPIAPPTNFIFTFSMSPTSWLTGFSSHLLTLADINSQSALSSILHGKQRNLGQSSGCDFPAIFNFGDSNSDTGGKYAAFHRIPEPNGDTFFQTPTGRYCDGKVIIDFIVEKLGLPYLSAYQDSIDTKIFDMELILLREGLQFSHWMPECLSKGLAPFLLTYSFCRLNGVNSNIKSKLPRPEDFSQALCTFDIVQNDLDGAFKSMIHNYTNKEQEHSGYITQLLLWALSEYSVLEEEILGTSCSKPSAYIRWDDIQYSHAANLWVANKTLDGLLSDPPTPITEACRMPLQL
ncbi:hypothetical protein CRYUN_Cryun04dG0149900 [Craigia yunnanensis]